MSSSLRASLWRLAGGAVLAASGLAVAVFLLPDASDQRIRTDKEVLAANATLSRQQAELKAAQVQADRLRADRQALDELMRNMPAEGVGKLHWLLSQKLFELAKTHQVRLISVKYGTPAREGTKASTLESVDVEFIAVGVYQHLKPFMLALEKSKLPFAVVGAKLEEAPEGAHLTITLRAFRQTGASPEPPAGEGA